VALITAIALSLVLLMIAAALNQAGFFTRATLLEAEYKERSLALAEACADTALLRLALDPAYVGSETVTVGTSTCDIRPLNQDHPNCRLSAGQNTIETRAVFQEAVTNLCVVVVSSDLSIIVSWKDVPSFY